ncbi:hypothetical protein Bca52824_069119 [Brassica carinata]|uniref:Uncharacterized protein n=1 Tax=Brassica carinata TaxID=52824 RepID=A0A8X7Q201_BRACI|nr:hypothetical protein Bca52824_069119 [Brassica carinata]
MVLLDEKSTFIQRTIHASRLSTFRRRLSEAEEDQNWLDSGGSQFILDSQQLVEALSLCNDLLQVGSQDTNNNGGGGGLRNKQPCFGDYSHFGGTEDFKRDLEDCQKLVLDPSCNIDLDTPSEFHLSQLESRRE